MKIAILHSQVGQLGNRLQSAAYFLSAFQGSSTLCIVDSFRGYEHLRRSSRLKRVVKKAAVTGFVKLASKSQRLRSLLRITVLQGEQDKPLILTSPEVRAQLRKSRFVLVTGYFIYADPALLYKHADDIFKRINLAIAASDRDYIEQLVAGDQDTTVGIHIRHGDFAEYKDGAYFYPFSHYKQVAESLVQSHPDKKIRFVICSDTEVPDDAFSGLDCHMGPGSVIGDLYALSQCDYVVGPRSTFNRWSAYWGKKPRFQVGPELGTTSFRDFKLPENLTMPAPSPEFRKAESARPATDRKTSHSGRSALEKQLQES